MAYDYNDPIEKQDKNISEGNGRTITRSETQRIYKVWKAGDKDEYGGFLNWSKRDNPITTFESLSGEGYREVDNCPITKGSYQDYTWEQYALAVDAWLTANKNKKARENEDSRNTLEKWSGDYLFT